MRSLQSAVVVALLLGTLGSDVKENRAYPTSYAYFPGYTRFEENTVIEVSGLGYDEVYYRVLGEKTEYRLPDGTEGFAIPEAGRYRFYVYGSDGMVLDITRELGVSVYHSVTSTDMNADNRGIIPVQKK